jgi:3-deoxy-manno-octulosonate cytidylyltransferase (CMP-KDO synthetase)
LNKSSQEITGIIIPARLNSERLKQKLLIEISGLPMIEHVRRRAKLNSYGLPVVVATGDSEIKKTVLKFGGEVVETVDEHKNGLSRVGEAAKTLNWKRYIILQGDEMLIKPTDLNQFIKANINIKPEVTINAISNLESMSEIENSSIVKCVIKTNKEIMYISRTSFFEVNNFKNNTNVFKISGLFSIASKILHLVISNENTPFAEIQSIEQLKFLELNLTLQSCLLDIKYPSVNLLQDLVKVKEILKTDMHQQQILKFIT